MISESRKINHCKYCDKGFVFKTSLERHEDSFCLTRGIKTGMARCPFCQDLVGCTGGRNGFVQHQKNRHPGEIYFPYREPNDRQERCKDVQLLDRLMEIGPLSGEIHPRSGYLGVYNRTYNFYDVVFECIPYNQDKTPTRQNNDCLLDRIDTSRNLCSEADNCDTSRGLPQGSHGLLG